MKCTHCGSAVRIKNERCPVCGNTPGFAHKIAHAFTKKRTWTVCAAVLLAVVLIITALSNRTPQADIPLLPTEPVIENLSAAEAYAEVIEEYRTVLSLSELTWQNEADRCTELHPRVNRTYAGFYHIGLFDSLYAAYDDIDGSGTEELFIGIGDKYGVNVVGMYAFNGNEAVMLSLSDYNDTGYQLLADGLFIQSNKDGTIKAVRSIAANGCELEDAAAPDIPLGELITDAALSAHGGYLTVENWYSVPLN